MSDQRKYHTCINRNFNYKNLAIATQNGNRKEKKYIYVYFFSVDFSTSEGGKREERKVNT